MSLFRKGIPAIEVPHFYIAPDYSCNPLIFNLNSICWLEPKYKKDEDDADIDNNWKYTNDRHFLKDADLFFKDKD